MFSHYTNFYNRKWLIIRSGANPAPILAALFNIPTCWEFVGSLSTIDRVVCGRLCEIEITQQNEIESLEIPFGDCRLWYQAKCHPRATSCRLFPVRLVRPLEIGIGPPSRQHETRFHAAKKNKLNKEKKIYSQLQRGHRCWWRRWMVNVTPDNETIASAL